MGTRKSVPVIVNSDEARPDLRPSWPDLGATECFLCPYDSLTPLFCSLSAWSLLPSSPLR
jgi:hypothetical protein